MRPVAERFDAAGKGIYLVGGIVRDLLVNRTLGPRADVDLPTDARPAETNRSSATGPRVVEPGSASGPSAPRRASAGSRSRVAVVNNVAAVRYGNPTTSPGEPSTSLARFLVAVLDRRALHEVRGRAERRAADAAVLGGLAAADGVDDHAGRVRGVPCLELGSTLRARRRSCRSTRYRPTCGSRATAHGRSGRCGRRRRRCPWSIWLVTDCVFESSSISGASARACLVVHVAAEGQLVCEVDRGATILEQAGEHAVSDSHALLALDVVADDRRAASSTSQPLGVARDKRRDSVDEHGLRVEAGLRVGALRLLGPDQEVGHEDIGAHVAWTCTTSTAAASDSSQVSR